jgi:hypothetical protein
MAIENLHIVVDAGRVHVYATSRTPDGLRREPTPRGTFLTASEAREAAASPLLAADQLEPAAPKVASRVALEPEPAAAVVTAAPVDVRTRR